MLCFSRDSPATAEIEIGTSLNPPPSPLPPVYPVDPNLRPDEIGGGEIAGIVLGIVFGVLSVVIVAWIFYPQIIEFLLEPYCRTLEAGEECQLYVRNPLEPFSVRLTVAGYGGIMVAMPMILWQFWAFVAPGLYSHEKRYALPFVWGA